MSLTINFSDYLKAVENKAATAIDGSINTGHGKYSVGIVCSKNNGKRVTLTAALSTKLKLKDALFVTAYAEDGVVFLGNSPLNKSSVKVTLSGEDKKIAYNSDLVHFLIKTFNLDFSHCVSRSFTDIVFNDDAEAPMAVLNFGTVNVMQKQELEVSNESDVDS